MFGHLEGVGNWYHGGRYGQAGDGVHAAARGVPAGRRASPPNDVEGTHYVLGRVEAVLLTTAGIAAPRVLYAREAANFHELAAEVNAVAENAAMLSMQADSEELLLELRSTEAHALPAKLTAAGKDQRRAAEPGVQEAASPPLPQHSPKRWTVEAVPKGHADAAQKALAAGLSADLVRRRARLLAFYADISAEGVETVDTKGTVTLERVQQTKRLHAANVELAAERAEVTARLSDKNADLTDAVAAVEALTTAEANRVATATLKELDELDAEAELLGVDPEEARLEENRSAAHRRNRVAEAVERRGLCDRRRGEGHRGIPGRRARGTHNADSRWTRGAAALRAPEAAEVPHRLHC